MGLGCAWEASFERVYMGFVKGRCNDLKGPLTQAVRGREAQAYFRSCPRYGDSDDMSDGEDEEAGGRKVRREKNISRKSSDHHSQNTGELQRP